jgi:tripeptidyl-peptidase-1
MGIAAGIPASFLSVGGDTATAFSTALFDTTTFLTTTANPPTVVTTSYADDETNFSTQDMQ